MKTPFTLVITLLTVSFLCAQKVGINTDNPHSVLHVHSAGQVHHPDGLFLLGSRTEAHMMADFNYLQSFWNDQGGVINMYLQPHGGNVGINVPFNSASFAPLHVYGEGVNNTTYGLGVFGNRTLKHLVVDFDRIQARNNNDPDKLYLQATGGDIDMGSGTLYVDESAERVGVSTVTPQAQFDILSNGNTSVSKALQVRNSNYANMLIVRDDGNVGIGTSAPNYKLHVIGDAAVTSKLRHAGDDDTFMEFFSDKVTFDVGNKEFLDMTESTNGQDYIRLGTWDVDVNLSDRLYIDQSAWRVGIGTATPDYTLDVSGSIGVSQDITHNGDSDTYINYTTDRILVYAGGIQMMDMRESGFNQYVELGDNVMWVDIDAQAVGIGTAAPETDLHIAQSSSGGIILENQDDHQWKIRHGSGENLLLYFNGGWRGSFNEVNGDYNSSSDRRLKKNIAEIGPVLDKVNLLSPKLYHFKTQDDTAQKSIGFIAQEVLEVFPEVVHYNEEDDMYGLDYNDFGVISIQAIQELSKLVKEQQMHNEQLAADNADLRSRLEKIEAVVATLTPQTASSN